MIHHYFRPKWSSGAKLSENNKQVAELARGTAREGYVVKVLMRGGRSPDCCASCGEVEGLCPMRVPIRGEQIVCLLCLRCSQRANAHETGHGEISKAIRTSVHRDKFQVAYLFQNGPRIRMVWGRRLKHEVLS